MSSPAQRERVQVVLVSPRNPLNIGAAARAMANFGFSRLAVVAPYAPNWREARSAVGAPELLRNGTECATLAEAVSGCALVIGTGTITQRKPQQRVVTLPALAPEISRCMGRGGDVALVFGPEKRGLTRDDLSYCHLLVEIPTAPEQPSMNLGQAVAVCLYELASWAFETETGAAGEAAAGRSEEAARKGDPATSATLELLAELADQAMIAADYSPPEMRAGNRHDVRLLLRRLTLTERDAHGILRLFRRVLWKLRR